MIVNVTLDRARARWNSPIYSFFRPDVTIAYDTKYGKYHYFKCNAPSCKGTGGVRRYQKTDDHSSTSNLRTHAIKCFGKDAVAAAMSGADSSARPDGSIFSAFGRQGARPVTVTHRAHTNAQIRYVLTPCYLSCPLRVLIDYSANLVRWITESNRSIRIVEDRKYRDLMLAGRPQAELPSRYTVARDIKTSFERCSRRIDELLQV